MSAHHRGGPDGVHTALARLEYHFRQRIVVMPSAKHGYGDDRIAVALNEIIDKRQGLVGNAPGIYRRAPNNQGVGWNGSYFLPLGGRGIGNHLVGNAPALGQRVDGGGYYFLCAARGTEIEADDLLNLHLRNAR